MVFQKEDLRRARSVERATVIVEDIVQGHVSSVVYGDGERVLGAHFELDAPIDEEYCCCLPIFDYEQIQCMICNTIHGDYSEACKCIQKSPAIRGIKPKLVQLVLYKSYDVDELNKAIRSRLMAKHFGGILSQIILD